MSFVIRSSAQWREVRDKINLIRVARALLGEPEQQNRDTFFWSCPFNNRAKSPIQITEGNSRWKCSECGKRGDAVDLVRYRTEMTFSKALEFLSRPEFFYPDEEEIDTESSVCDGADASIEVNDTWIEDLLRDSPKSD